MPQPYFLKFHVLISEEFFAKYEVPGSESLALPVLPLSYVSEGLIRFKETIRALFYGQPA